MPIDLIKETVAKGYALLLDESAIRNTKFVNFLIQNKNNFPPQSIVLLRSVGNGVAGQTLRNGFLGISGKANPIILAGYDKPAGSALIEKGGSKKLAIVTADSAKAQIYAGVDTAVPHLTVLIDSMGVCSLVSRPSQGPAPKPVPPTPPAPQGAQEGPEHEACIKPNHVFTYNGGKKISPPALGSHVDVACPPSPDAEIGKEFVGLRGKVYKLTVPVGAGASAQIYRCDDPNVVVKRFFNKQLYTSEQEKIHFMAEHPLQHPHIIWPLDMVSKRGNNRTLKDIGYVMRSCPYGDLEATKGPMPMNKRFKTKERLIRAIVQLLDAFECMQQANIVNGDIKLQNCVFDDKSGDAYVVDLDAVQIDKWINRMASNFYIPPEDYQACQAHGGNWQFYREKSSDNYAIAVMLFFLLMGGYPFSSNKYNCADDAVAKAVSARGEFPYAGDNQSIQHAVHPSYYVRWTHLPSFIRQAFVDTFNAGGKYFSPAKRLTPGAWKKLFLSYLQMVRDPQSKLAKADPDYYNVPAPLMKKSGKGLADIDLKLLDIQAIQEVDAKGRGTNLEKAVDAAIRNARLSLRASEVAMGLMKGRGTYVSGGATFKLTVCLPFLKVVTVHAKIIS